MFSFRKQNAQAKKRAVDSTASYEFEWKAIYTWILMLLLLMGGITYITQKSTLLPIKTIKLSGSFEYIDQKDVESILQPYVGEGFFSLDIHAVQQSLSDKAWTDSVSIRRVWPDQLDISIVEKKPVARWDNGKLISDKAVVFAADTHAFQNLPLVHASNSEAAGILRQYYALSRRFDLLEETVIALRQDNRGALDIELADGLIIKVGRDDIDHKITRLITIYKQQIQPRRADINQLDLRYSNGFAVAWKKEILENRDEASIWSNSNV